MSRASTCGTEIISGIAPPRATTNGASSATLSVRWYVRNRLMLSKAARPSSTASTMCAKLSSSGGLSGDVGPGPAHRDTDVGPTRGRGVVHAVAGHRHDLARGLERAGDPQLLLGSEASQDRSVGAQEYAECHVAVGEFGPEHHGVRQD